MSRDKKYFRGCLLGGAIGDALGWTVEFLTTDEIKKRYGKQGIVDLVLGRMGKAEITDDTQMTLFTAEGLLTTLEGGVESNVVAHVYDAYLAWLYTQGGKAFSPSSPKSWLLEIEEIFAKRAPGRTCMEALSSGKMGRIEKPLNDSKGCGGVMRVAPIGLIYQGKKAFHIACEVAAITHGHPSGYLSAGIFVSIIAEIISGDSIEGAIKTSLGFVKEYEGHHECVHAIEKALDFVKKDISPETAIKEIGEGWVGEEALAIAIYCSLKYQENFKGGIITAVNHDGDSDSTGAITGNILGTYLGIEKIPKEWIKKLELQEVITQMADDLYRLNEYGAV